jgi:hypothetical protein
MTDQKLSIAAQAVLDAYQSASRKVMLKSPLAAAICVVADHVAPHMEEPDWGACEYMKCDIELYTDHQRKRAELLTIAAELEAQS